MYKSSLLFFLSVVWLANANTQPLAPVRHQLLDSMTSAIENNLYTNIHSLLISKGGVTVYEHYKVYSFFPLYQQLINKDERKKEMTIRNLLEMESGFDCEEFNDGKECESDMQRSRDWVRFSLDLPLKNNPGTVWAYTSSNPVIIGGIISHAAKMSIMDFAKKYLFDPLEITDYRWTVDSMGQATTAGSFFIKPSDMLKIGDVVRQNGKWKAHRIVSEAWLKESTHTAISIPDFSFAKLSSSEILLPQPAYYGYYWYSEVIKTKNQQEKILFASGNGGQYIMILKNADLVVVFTQGNYNSRKAKRAFDILARYILPAFSLPTVVSMTIP